MTYRVIITAQALDKISEQVEFIAVKSSAPLNAARWLERVSTPPKASNQCPGVSRAPRSLRTTQRMCGH
jgi:hypothetical protein